MEKELNKKGKTGNTVICLRIPKELEKQFINYKKLFQISNNSIILAQALEALFNEKKVDEDVNLFRFDNIDSKLNRMEVMISLFTNLFGFYMRHWFLHTNELPVDANLQASIIKKATQRYDRFVNAFIINEKAGSNLIARFIQELGLGDGMVGGEEGDIKGKLQIC